MSDTDIQLQLKPLFEENEKDTPSNFVGVIRNVLGLRNGQKIQMEIVGAPSGIILKGMSIAPGTIQANFVITIGTDGTIYMKAWGERPGLTWDHLDEEGSSDMGHPPITNAAFYGEKDYPTGQDS